MLVGKSIEGSEGTSQHEDLEQLRQRIAELEKERLVLKEAERRHAFLFALTERLRNLADPLIIMDEATRMLGEHLHVAQVGYGEIDILQEHLIVHRDWNDGRISSFVGTWCMGDFGPPFIAEMKKGKTVALPDVTKSSLTNAPLAVATYESIATRSMVDVPLIKSGRMVAVLFIHHPEPRSWSAAEITLIEETCERLWATVERARAEEVLRENEARFRVALRAGRFGLWDWNQATGRIISDEVHKRLFGLDPSYSSVDADEVFATIHPDDREQIHASLDRALQAQGFFEAEFRVVLPDGELRWLSGYGDVVRDPVGEPLRIVGVNQDITERKRTQEALQTIRERLQVAQEAGQVGVFEWDMQTNRAWVSPNLQAMAGFAEGEWDGTLDGWVKHIHADDHTRVMTLLAAVYARSAPEVSFEFRMVLPDGTVRWIYGRGRIHYDAEGVPVRMVGINLDLTERRRIEEALRQSNEELERFASVASHDLQEPLRMVTSYSQLLARRYHGQLDEQADEFIGFITDGAKRMNRLVQDLLLHARSTSSEPLQLRPANANVALALALANLGERIDETRPTLTWDPLPELLAVEGLLAQVFQNLISNALKYMRPDVTPEIHVSAERKGAEWIISVRDNGQGIAPEHQKRIFTLFTRLHGKDVSGSGIGLATVKRIVERHGGRIWVESEPGIGSTFFFTLPAIQDASSDLH